MAAAAVTHYNARCNSCADHVVIVGVRWTCTECPEFDVCDTCHSTGRGKQAHDKLKGIDHDAAFRKLEKLAPHFLLRAKSALSEDQKTEIAANMDEISRWVNFRFFLAATNKLLEEFVTQHGASLQTALGFYTYITAVIWVGAPFLSDGLDKDEREDLRTRWVGIATGPELKLTKVDAKQRWDAALLHLKNTRMNLAKQLSLKESGPPNVNHVLQVDGGAGATAAGKPQPQFAPVPDRFVSPSELSMVISVLQDDFQHRLTRFHLKTWTMSVGPDGQSVGLPDEKMDFKRMQEQKWTTAPAHSDFYISLLKKDDKNGLNRQRLLHAAAVIAQKRKSVQAWHATELLKLNCFIAAMVDSALEFRKDLRKGAVLSQEEYYRIELIRNKLSHHSVLFSEECGSEFVYALAKDDADELRTPSFAVAAPNPLSYWDIVDAFYSLPEWDAILQKLLKSW